MVMYWKMVAIILLLEPLFTYRGPSISDQDLALLSVEITAYFNFLSYVGRRATERF